MPKTSLQRSLFAAIAVLSFQFTLFGQTATPTPKPKPDDDVIKIDSRLVVVPVSVTDSSGQPVPGLTAKDFQIAEDGKAQAIESIGTADVVPLEIVLLFDVSASTDAMFKFEQQTAAKFLKDVMRPDDRAAIYIIGQKPQMVQSRETAETSVSGIMSITPQKGATAFFDTVALAAQNLRTNSPAGRRRVVVVISDGDDNFSDGVQKAMRLSERKIVDDPDYKKVGSLVLQAQQAAKVTERTRVTKSLQDADTVFYSINPGGSSYLLNHMSVFGQENMRQFADETGGTAFLPKFAPIDTKDNYQNDGNIKKNQDILERIFRQLESELRAQYLIQYYSESDYPLNKYVKLDVKLTNRPDRIRSRQGYYVKN